MNDNDPHIYTLATFAGVGAVLLLLLIAHVTSGVRALFMGEDKRPSTSKFQFFVWTGVIAFAYAAIFTRRLQLNLADPIVDKIPANVLIVMGFSATTLAGAKAITEGYIATGRVTKDGEKGGLAAGDDGQSDLGKIQLLFWTLIGVLMYGIVVFKADVGKGLPDIDASLMVLMGLGQGAYLGKKLVTVDTPRVDSVTLKARPGQTIEIKGSSLGSRPGNVTLDGIVVPTETWADTRVTLVLPSTHPTGVPWQDRRLVTLSVDTGGRTAVGAQNITVILEPRIRDVKPTEAKVGATITLVGDFYATSTPIVQIGGVTATLQKSSDEEISVVVPSGLATGPTDLTVTVDTQKSVPLVNRFTVIS